MIGLLVACWLGAGLGFAVGYFLRRSERVDDGELHEVRERLMLTARVHAKTRKPVYVRAPEFFVRVFQGGN